MRFWAIWSWATSIFETWDSTSNSIEVTWFTVCHVLILPILHMYYPRTNRFKYLTHTPLSDTFLIHFPVYTPYPEATLAPSVPRCGTASSPSSSCLPQSLGCFQVFGFGNSCHLGDIWWNLEILESETPIFLKHLFHISSKSSWFCWFPQILPAKYIQINISLLVGCLCFFVRFIPGWLNSSTQTFDSLKESNIYAVITMRLLGTWDDHPVHSQGCPPVSSTKLCWTGTCS